MMSRRRTKATKARRVNHRALEIMAIMSSWYGRFNPISRRLGMSMARHTSTAHLSFATVHGGYKTIDIRTVNTAMSNHPPTKKG
jgi:hypothetical protein